MRYFAERLDAYRHPSKMLEASKSILMLAANYRTVEPAEPGEGQARVSRLRLGPDYHEVIRGRLHKLADFHRRLDAHGRGPGRGRHRAASGAAVRPTGRPGLDRQEHAA